MTSWARHLTCQACPLRSTSTRGLRPCLDGTLSLARRRDWGKDPPIDAARDAAHENPMSDRAPGAVAGHEPARRMEMLCSNLTDRASQLDRTARRRRAERPCIRSSGRADTSQSEQQHGDSAPLSASIERAPWMQTVVSTRSSSRKTRPRRSSAARRLRDDKVFTWKWACWSSCRATTIPSSKTVPC